MMAGARHAQRRDRLGHDHAEGRRARGQRRLPVRRRRQLVLVLPPRPLRGRAASRRPGRGGRVHRQQRERRRRRDPHPLRVPPGPRRRGEPVSDRAPDLLSHDGRERAPAGTRSLGTGRRGVRLVQHAIRRSPAKAHGSCWATGVETPAGRTGSPLLLPAKAAMVSATVATTAATSRTSRSTGASGGDELRALRS